MGKAGTWGESKSNGAGARVAKTSEVGIGGSGEKGGDNVCQARGRQGAGKKWRKRERKQWQPRRRREGRRERRREEGNGEGKKGREPEPGPERARGRTSGSSSITSESSSASISRYSSNSPIHLRTLPPSPPGLGSPASMIQISLQTRLMRFVLCVITEAMQGG